MTKILVVSHEASLTGAPRIAVEVLRATRGIVDERVVVIRWPGPLSDDLTRAADRARLEPFRRSRVALRRFRRSRAFAVRVEEAAARMILRREKPDLVYLNTLKSACYVRPALDLGCRVVLHSHEMDELASHTLARYHLGGAYGRIRLVACSWAAQRCLQELTGVEDVAVVPSVVDSDRVRGLAEAPSAEATTASEIGRSRAGLVVACGTADHRKGTDLWLEVVRLVKATMGDRCPLFVWIGDHSTGHYDSRARTLGVGDRVRFLGPTPNPYPLIATADILTVPSRQDAFPLVVFEAMSLGTAVVAFDVGGIADQVGEAGTLAPSGDIAKMAEAVVRLMGSADERERLAELGRVRVDDLYSLDRFEESVAGLVRTTLRTVPGSPAEKE